MDYNIVKELIEKEIMIFSKKILPHFDSNVYALEKIGELEKKCEFLEYKINNIKELLKNDITLITNLEKQIKEISIKIIKNDNNEEKEKKIEKKIFGEIKKIKNNLEKQIKDINIKIIKNDNEEKEKKIEKKIMSEIKKIKNIIEKKNDKIKIINEEIKKIEHIKIKDSINEKKNILSNEKFITKEIFLKTKKYLFDKINNNFNTINKKFDLFKKSFFKKIEKDTDENQKEIISKIMKINDILQIYIKKVNLISNQNNILKKKKKIKNCSKSHIGFNFNEYEEDKKFFDNFDKNNTEKITISSILKKN